MTLPPTELGAWFRAGLGDGHADIGRSAVPQEPWTIPHTLELGPGRLRWEEDDVLDDGSRTAPPAVPLQRADVKPDMLGRFVNTWDDQDGAEILDFARTFGVLKLCSVGLPPRHRHSALFESAPEADNHRLCCIPTAEAEGTPYVDLTAWRLWARRAKAMLTIVAKLHVSELPDVQAWADAQNWPEGEPRQVLRWRKAFDHATAVDIERGIASLLLNEWLALGQVGFVSRWEDNSATPTARAAGYGLFGALGLQLLLTTAKSDGLAICSSCGLPYVPPRKPSAGRDQYCQSCGKQAARREASRRYRARNRAQEGNR